MPSASWADRVARLVKAYKPARQTAFRNDFRAAISSALANGELSRDDEELLLKARSYVEGWNDGAEKSAGDAWNQWMDLYASGKDRLPRSLLEACLSRFPTEARKGLDWAPVVLGEEENFIEFLVSHQFVRTSELVAVAKKRPAEFYVSAALDVLLNHGVPCPRVVLSAFEAGDDRPSERMAGSEVVARSFALDSAPSAESWLFKILLELPDQRRNILEGLLDAPATAIRFAHYLVQPIRGLRNRKRTIAERNALVVLGEWLALSVATLHGDPESESAGLVVGLVQQYAFANRRSVAAEVLEGNSAAVEDILEEAIRRGLRVAEAGRGKHEATRPFLVPSEVLYRAVHNYLRSLPTAGMSDTPERSLQYERFQGRREVLQSLVAAFADGLAEHELRGAIEVSLFNAGVREYGEEGGTTSYDVHLHEPTSSGILANDVVRVIRRGYAIGEGQDAIVLVKARVEAPQL